MKHIEDIEERIRRFDQKLLAGISEAGDALMVLQTLLVKLEPTCRFGETKSGYLPG